MGCLLSALGFLLLIGCTFFGAGVVFHVMHYFDPSAPVFWGSLVSTSLGFVFSLIFGIALLAIGLGENRKL